MPFCPSCGYEYEAGVTRCTDCDTELVAALPDNVGDAFSHIAEEDWIEIARLTSLQYAEMLLEVWHKNNIPSILRSHAGFFGQTGQMGTDSFTPVGDAFSLLVAQDYLVEADAEAEAMLGETWRAARIIDIEIEGEDD
jgi:hypothetical protein